MLGNLSDPEAVGPGLAIAFLMLLYAGIFAEFIISGLQQSVISNAGTRVLSDPTQTAGKGLEQNRSMIGKVMAVLFLVLLQFGVLLTSLSSHQSGDFQISWLNRFQDSSSDEQPGVKSATETEGKWY